MVNCDTQEALPALKSPLAGNVGGICRATQDTTETEFLKDKGFLASDFGNPVPGVAYTLISHGASGLGAHTSSGTQKLPLPVSSEELANLSPSGAFVARAQSQDADPEAATHFDDLIAYRTIADLVKRANLSGRNWPDTVLASVRFDAATVGNAKTPGSTATVGDLNTQTLIFNTAQVTGFNSLGNANLALASSAGNEGLGIAGGGGNNLSSTGGEGLNIELLLASNDPRPTQFAFTMNDFGDLFSWSDRVELRFFNANIIVNPAPYTIKQSCRDDPTLASFAVNVGAAFDRIEIRPLPTTTAFSFTLASSFALSELRACATGVTCTTSLDTGSAPAGNRCP